MGFCTKCGYRIGFMQFGMCPKCQVEKRGQEEQARKHAQALALFRKYSDRVVVSLDGIYFEVKQPDGDLLRGSITQGEDGLSLLIRVHTEDGNVIDLYGPGASVTIEEMETACPQWIALRKNEDARIRTEQQHKESTKKKYGL